LSSFRIKGLGHDSAIGISPISLFDRKQSNAHVRLNSGFSNIVLPGKNQ
jgi:hypothetical protein